jgi:NADPH:quinone reductase-like Zn-dependent oxidoreductase
VRLAEIGPGDTLLVHGGSGGVGSFVVQLATMRGARVIATASARNHEAVKQLGAVQAIDHRTTRFEDVVRDVDAVIDTVGTETLARSAGVLERRGRLVGMSGRLPADACRARALECRYVDAANEDGALAALAQLFEQGKLRVRVDRVFTLADAAAAQEANRAGGGLGKIVVRVRDGG